MARKLLLLLLKLTASLAPAQEPLSSKELEPDYRQEKAVALEKIANYLEALFRTHYAMLRWKQHHWNWDLPYELELTHEQLGHLNSPQLDTIKPVFNRFLASPLDLHVGVFYCDPRLASLPFDVACAEGQVFITSSSSPLTERGDEILKVDGQSVLDYVGEVLYGTSAEKMPLKYPYQLPLAFFRLGPFVPLPKCNSSLQLQLLRKGKLVEVEVQWQADLCCYAPEEESLACQLPDLFKPCLRLCQYRLPNASAIGVEKMHKHSKQRRGGGNSPSFEEAHSYLYEEGGAKIGYFRLPAFDNLRDLKLFDSALNQFIDKNVKALVIDLRENPGGNLLIAYAFLSRLSDKPLPNLLDSSIISEEDAATARCKANQLETLLKKVHTESELYKALGTDHLLGYTINRQLLKELMLYYLDIAEQWESGHTCTRFAPILGWPQILPHPRLNYRAPLYLIIDNGSASCADLFPAILKDSARATVLGCTSAGAGGAIERYPLPNFAGIDAVALTCSVVLRNNQRVIEDLGVEPHHHYRRTVEDLFERDLELKRTLSWIAAQP